MALNTKQYFNRDLSWLRFNHRVLQEAADHRNPIGERLKFLAIFSSNLDEFFKVRVSDIRKIKQLDKPFRKKLITKPNKLLSTIKQQVDIQQKEFGRIFFTEILPSLEKENVYLKDVDALNAKQLKYISTYYSNVKNHFQPITNSDFSFLENEVLYLVGKLENEDLVWVKISNELSRFVEIPTEDDSTCVLFIDDIVRHAYAKEYKTKFYALKISRDAELYIDSEYSGDLLQKIEDALPNRETGQVTRALIDEKMPSELVKIIEKALDINDTDLIKGGTYHNFKDLFGFPNLNNDDLYFKPLPPLQNKELEPHEDIFKIIDKKDRLLCFPYESFADVVKLIETASEDPTVTKIKMTLYRVSKDSAVAKALLKAAKNGKQVRLFIETKARFDEENNMKWGKILEENGAHVNYSYPGIKVHSKILYIEKEENEETKSYAYIGTGNFNEKTSKIYTDFGLMTSNKKITSELLQVFQVLDRKLIIPKTKHLLVSPFSSRSTFIELVEKEIANAQNGKEAYITLKLNSLQDEKMIKLLYKASKAGVKMKLLVRGICCLVPGIEGQSEHITVVSIVDRFLEHGRVYLFANGGKEKLYIGSADWMTRNLDHRIEVITPILDAEVFEKLKGFLNLQLEDNVKSRIIDKKQNNNYVNEKNAANQSSQHLIYNSLI